METHKYIEVAYGHFVTAKQIGKVQIKIHDNNGKPFIDMLYTVLLEPKLCDWFFSIIMFMNLGHTWLFNKGLHTVLFGDN